MKNSKIAKLLAKRWEDSKINSGDILLLHSSMRRTILENRELDDFSLASVLDSFLYILGNNGTLLLPLFNFDYCNRTPFDIRSTPSHMGALTEMARTHSDAIRTWHPVYSFAVIGKYANDFKNLRNTSAYGNDSPFALLRSLDGKIGVIDLPDQNSMTFYHHVEECMQVPYRYYKDFEGKYTDNLGVETNKTFQIYVRDLESGVETFVEPMQEYLWEHELYNGNRPMQGNGLRTISASILFEQTSHIIQQDRAENMLYRIVKPAL